ncbi:TELO2-interacting protein 1 homolog [Elysia marginata]|uniref:TELO2-interacting protein 1 homolog n=1 Tax=Elysia marginata TaxID=1093978 RepID=A0AAV4HAW3_9GAST|nr:TELO2-interacting protein 1 homolog [Elysia marginata]
MAMPDLDQRRQASLELLRPVCISLMKDVSKEKVRALRDALSQVDDRIAQEIQQYILFPLQTRLRQKDLSESLICEVCEVVVVVFQKTVAASLATFFDTFNPLMFIVTPKDGLQRVVLDFEETKTSLIKAVKQLLKATQEVILSKIYTTEFIPALGQLVAVLLSFAELEKSRAVQKLALDCLLMVLQTDSKFGKKYKYQLAEFFPFCLPGVTMTACRIATGDTKQGHGVIVKALEVFGRVVSLVMQDTSLDKTTSQAWKQGSATTVELQRNQRAQPTARNLSVERSEDWVKATASKVKVLVDQLCKLVSRDNWRVRLGLAELCEQLLTSCSRSLSASVPKLLETLVGLINDPYNNVAKKATGALQAFSTAAAGDSTGAGERTLVEILEENLHGLATSLPRQIRMCGTNIRCVVDSAPHLSRLCLALVQVLELDVRDLRIVEERGQSLDKDPDNFADEHSSTVWKPRKYFKHFRDECILSESLRACRQLGKYGNIHTLVDHLLDLSQSSATYSLATTLVINEMVLGAGCLGEDNDSRDDMSRCINTELLPDVISLLMDEYLSPENLQHLDTVAGESTSTATGESPSLSTALVIVGADRSAEIQQAAVHRNRAVLRLCLHMEGLAKFAMVLGKDRQDHLIRTLYPLVENLGHENLYISSTAYSALVEVARAGGYRTLDCLLRDNADYLVSSVSLRLRHFQLNRRTPQTLCVMLKFCSRELLPQMKRSITQLLDSLDDNYTDDLVLFMPVLLELVKAIARWFPPPRLPPSSQSLSPSQSEKQNDQKNSVLDSQQLKNFLEDYVATKQLAEGNFSDEETNSAMSLEEIEREMKDLAKQKEEEAMDPVVEEEEEKEKEVPPHIVVVKEVFERVRNLLSTKNGRLRVQALDVVSQGVQCLKGTERELLPQVHQVWAGLRPLFQSQEKFIVVKVIFTPPTTNSSCASSPLLGLWLPIRDCHSGYLHTANYKLQLCVLSSVGPLASNLQLDRNHLDEVARLCVPYLDDAQPQALQQVCSGLLYHHSNSHAV